jgi:hypothetical protein
MKKRYGFVLSVIALTTLAAGCKSNTSSSATDSTQSTQSVETAPTLDEAITFRGLKQVEVGATLTVRATVSNAQNDQHVDFSIEEGSEGLISLENDGKNKLQIVVTGLKVGTAKLRATSVETHNYNFFTIEVVSAKPTLAKALETVTALENYTFTSKPVDADKVSDANTYVLKRTELAYTLTDNAGAAVAMDKIKDDDKDATGFAYVYGVSISADDTDKDTFGNAVELAKPIRKVGDKIVEGDLMNPAPVLKDAGTNEVLDYTNFAGLGTAASGPTNNPISTLANINPNWVSMDKNSSNVYKIEGSKDDVNAAFLESQIWKLVDPAGISGVAKTHPDLTDLYYYTIAEWIDTTIEVTEDSVIFTVSPAEGTQYIPAGSETAADYPAYVGVLSDVGTTTLAKEFSDVADLNAQGTNKLGCLMPALAEDVLNVKNAFQNDNYLETYELTKTIKYGIYRTKDYFFYDYDEEFNTNYAAAVKKNTGKTPDYVYPEGVYAGTDGYLHEVTFDKEYNITKDVVFTRNGQNVPAKMLTVAGNYVTSWMFNAFNGWANLSTTTEDFFGNGNKYYYTMGAKTCGMLVFDGYFDVDYDASAYVDQATGSVDFLGIANNSTISDGTTTYPVLGWAFGVQPHYTNVTKGEGDDAVTTAVLDSVDFMGFAQVTSQGNGFVFNSTYSKFGTATDNKAEAAIRAKLTK